jgi:hypothetical protein
VSKCKREVKEIKQYIAKLSNNQLKVPLLAREEAEVRKNQVIDEYMNKALAAG